MLDERIVALDNEIKKIDGSGEEDKIIEMINFRVSELMDKNPELLMSYLYRLDVLEKDLNKLLKSDIPISIADGITQLIWERQKKRLETKRQFKQDPIEGWEF